MRSLRTACALLALFFSFTQLHTQSFHTVSFAGNTSDFICLERRGSSTDHTDYWVTFDETGPYLEAFRTSGANVGDCDHFTVYIDTDF